MQAARMLALQPLGNDCAAQLRDSLLRHSNLHGDPAVPGDGCRRFIDRDPRKTAVIKV